jgi:hypothetical protein
MYPEFQGMAIPTSLIGIRGWINNAENLCGLGRVASEFASVAERTGRDGIVPQKEHSNADAAPAVATDAG